MSGRLKTGLLTLLLAGWLCVNLIDTVRLRQRALVLGETARFGQVSPFARRVIFHEQAQNGETAALVLAGDSHIQHGDWRQLLDRPVANRGINGETLTEFVARLPDLLAMHPHQLLLQIGSNDLDSIVLSPPQQQALVNTYAGLLDRLATEAPATQVIVTTILPVTDRHANGVASNAQLPAINAQLLALCAQHAHCSGLDASRVLADAAGNLRSDYSVDTEHLNADGYAAWAAQIKPTLAVAPQAR